MDIGLQIIRLGDDRLADVSRTAEEAGIDSLWLAGGGENYLKAQVAISATRRVRVGTCIVPVLLATPAFHAAMARRLHRSSAGRFVLGTGSQTRGQVRRAVGQPGQSGQPGQEADHLVGRGREAVEVIRALLSGEAFAYQGTFQRVSGSGGEPVAVPIYYSGVGASSLRAAGRSADGFLAHPIFTRTYLEQVAWPALDEGLERAGRTRAGFSMVALPMTLVAQSSEELPELVRRAKRNLAWYFTTRSYGPFMDLHGWGDQRQAIWEVAARAGHNARNFDLDEMESCITDEMVHEICLVGTADTVRRVAAARYRGVADALDFYPIVDPGAGPEAAEEQEERATRRVIDAFAGELRDRIA